MTEIEVKDMGHHIILSITTGAMRGASTATLIYLTPTQHKQLINVLINPTPVSYSHLTHKLEGWERCGYMVEELRLSPSAPWTPSCEVEPSMACLLYTSRCV